MLLKLFLVRLLKKLKNKIKKPKLTKKTKMKLFLVRLLKNQK